ncbi:MAG TPA: CDP-alcohol phosphatidyltransferase family protein [Blastocatellia bacterium]|nr:CDP-alcohol phosphatidyltransferase family protein [Blastocatellia bacterium]
MNLSVDETAVNHPGDRDDSLAGRTGELGLLNLPNALTLFRIVLILPFLYLISRGSYLMAMAVFVAAAVSDFADGYAARKLKQQSYAGRLLDPLADKLLITAAYIVMAIPHRSLPSIPLWLAIAVVGRDVLILLGSLAVYALVRFKDFKPAFISKVNTTVELAFILYFLLAQGWPPAAFLKAFALVCYLIVLITVVASAIEYANQGLAILKQERRRPA